ncbi:MAG: SpoIIE family protein phosphatase, partial [Burkholderiales bacterium]|nr:SpoIIE family protein phosphatase [Burkholderiales bacterium]
LAHPEPAPSRGLAAAAAGGVGVHLVRRFADDVQYGRDGGRNRVTVRSGARALSPRRWRRRGARPASFPLARRDGTWVERDERSRPDRRSHGAIARTALFRGIVPADVDRILARCELCECAAGEVLFRAGEHHRCVLVAVEGRLEVRLDGPDSPFFVELGPGECVGELSVADGKANSAWVVAATDCRILAIPEPVFIDDVLGERAVVRNLIVVLSERMRRSNGQIVQRLRAELELQALQRELDAARRIQASMLPRAPLCAEVRGFEARGFMRAARQVGGDFYDAFPLGEGRMFVAIGDVCGKGMPAALYMVRALTILRGEALHGGRDASRGLARSASRCNDLLAEANEEGQFVTIFAAIVDAARARIDFVNAGHNPPLLAVPGGPPLFLDRPRNPLAGLVPGLRFASGRADFPPGALLLLYTDGVTEAERGDGAQFGEDTLRALLADGDRQLDCVDRIVAAVDDFAAGHAQSDDITLLAVLAGDPVSAIPT